MAMHKRYARTAYAKLIVTARARQLSLGLACSCRYPGYHKHHIWPQSFSVAAGNEVDNRPSNLVFLTYAEHYEAHKLLAAIWCGRGVRGAKAATAWWRMCHGKTAEYATAEDYEVACAQFSRQHHNKQPEAKPRLAANLARLNRQRATKGLLSAQSNNGKAKLREAGIAYSRSDAGRLKSKLTMTKTANIVRTCPHCCKVGKGNSFKSAHFSHCRLLKELGSSCLLVDRPKNKTEALLATTAKLLAEGRHNTQRLHKCCNCGLTGQGPRFAGKHFDKCQLLLHIGKSCSLADKPEWHYCLYAGCNYSCHSKRALAGHQAKHKSQTATDDGKVRLLDHDAAFTATAPLKHHASNMTLTEAQEKYRI